MGGQKKIFVYPCEVVLDVVYGNEEEAEKSLREVFERMIEDTLNYINSNVYPKALAEQLNQAVKHIEEIVLDVAEKRANVIDHADFSLAMYDICEALQEYKKKGPTWSLVVRLIEIGGILSISVGYDANKVLSDENIKSRVNAE